MEDQNTHKIFSKRIGIDVEVPKIQDNFMSNNLRIDLYNNFYQFCTWFIQEENRKNNYENAFTRYIFEKIWIEIYRYPIDEMNSSVDKVIAHFKVTFLSGKWHLIYDILEKYISEINIFLHDSKSALTSFVDRINNTLKLNNSAYRISDLIFIKISGTNEMESIEETKSLLSENGLNTVKNHFNASIHLLSQRPIPDYRNSIKESISMVESIARIIEPSSNTLGKALSKLKENNFIDKHLYSIFEKLYGFTNGESGIRHAIMEEGNIDYEEAKYFLLNCSAFTSYLVEKAIKMGIELK